MKKKLTLALVALLTLLPLMSSYALFYPGKHDTVTIDRAEYERLKQYAMVDEVRQYIEEYYYEEPDQQKLTDGAIQGLLSGLNDAYSFYYPEEAWKKMWEDDEGKYAGIGVQMLGNWRDGSVTVVRVFKNTPAEAAGLKKGDVFYKVEDLEVNTTTMQDAVDVMRGKPGEKVHVEIVRNGEVLPFELTKAEINVNRMEYKMLENNVGYIAAYEFAGDLDKEFEAAFKDLEKNGAKSLIIDLRDNPGGWVTLSINIADLFLDKTLLFYAEDRAGNQEKSFTKDGKSDIPLVVLINKNSASSSEIFAGAMKDLKRAAIVGEKSFGKGIIQSVVTLSDGKTGFQFTTAQYFTPNGNKVHKEGITPDIQVEMPEDIQHELFELGDLKDPQLKAAYDTALGLAK